MKPAIIRLPPAAKGWIQGLALAPDGALWALRYRSALLRSTDGGDTWTDVPAPATRWLTAVAVTPDGAVLVGDEKGHLHETGDLGQTWEHTPLRGGKHLWSALVTPDAALAGVGGNVFRRRHGDSGWTPAKKGPRGSAVRRLSRTDDGTLFVACAHTYADRAAWRSLDGGDTWLRVLEADAASVLDVHASGGRAYALLDSKALLTSDDRGATWQRRALPFDPRGARIWSAGPVLYVFDVRHEPATADEIGEVWRSPDGGESWTMLWSFALAVRSVAPTAAGDILLGGTLDDHGAFARWRDPEVASFLPARALAPTRAPVAAAPPPASPRPPEAAMLDRVLVAWRAKRHPELAKLVDALGARCAPDPPPTEQAPWMALAKRRRPEDLSALTETWLHATTDEAKLRFDALGRFDDDPRVAVALAVFVRDFACGATSSKPFWTAVGAGLVALRDPRTAAVVDEASRAPILVRGATMKAWLGRYVPKLAGELAKACGQTPPLDAADRALCAEAARLLY